MNDINAGPTASDEELVVNARSGDQAAFAELWRRHNRSGVRVARQFTSSIDADDLVSEAYARIYERVIAGGGPSGAFRPYLYTTIRNLASTWGARSRDIQVDDIADFEDPATLDDPVAHALDRTLTARAFRSLPERWQSVLWYTEVEGMDPHEVAPLFGMSPNGVAALSYRAREGLRRAWLQAHVTEAGTSAACKWTMTRLGENSRHSLTPREQERVTDHLATCAKCAIVSEEIDELGSRLALVLLPIMLGAGVGGLMLASLNHGSAALASTAAVGVLPAVPASVAAAATPAVFAPAVGTGLAMGAATGMSALVGSVAVVAAIGGSVVLGLGSVGAPPATTSAGIARPAAVPTPTARADIGTGAPAAGPVGGLISGVGSIAGTVVNAAGDDAAAPLTADLQFGGKGTPGAVVAAQAGGVVYGTARVAADGTWTIRVSALPATVGSLAVQQKLIVLGVTVPITTPLSLTAAPAGVGITLTN